LVMRLTFLDTSIFHTDPQEDSQKEVSITAFAFH
jgi:hypothetical protein